jgi:catechol 2,3-dioxygenase-like lactoylglutathione lyase family enzyme
VIGDHRRREKSRELEPAVTVRRTHHRDLDALPLRLTYDEPDRVRLSSPDYRVILIHDRRPLTAHVHIAFGAQDDANRAAFHAAALAAGYEDHGGRGERAVYDPGYYGAFVLDPDGHNVEVVNHNR